MSKDQRVLVEFHLTRRRAEVQHPPGVPQSAEDVANQSARAHCFGAGPRPRFTPDFQLVVAWVWAFFVDSTGPQRGRGVDDCVYGVEGESDCEEVVGGVESEGGEGCFETF